MLAGIAGYWRALPDFLLCVLFVYLWSETVVIFLQERLAENFRLAVRATMGREEKGAPMIAAPIQIMVTTCPWQC